jgi:hypothetical protein
MASDEKSKFQRTIPDQKSNMTSLASAFGSAYQPSNLTVYFNSEPKEGCRCMEKIKAASKGVLDWDRASFAYSFPTGHAVVPVLDAARLGKLELLIKPYQACLEHSGLDPRNTAKCLNSQGTAVVSTQLAGFYGARGFHQ